MTRRSARLTIAALAMLAAGAGGPAGDYDPATGALKPPRLDRSERIGVAHIGPHYVPNGKFGPGVLVDGAEDAYRLGFRAIKVAANHQVVSLDWSCYGLPAETIRRVGSVEELVKLDPYRRLFAMPFRTFVIVADVIGDGNWDTLCSYRPGPNIPAPPDRPLGEAARANIYRQIHALSKHLLATYRGSGKVFILQNHEADWHDVPATDPGLDPSDVALKNTEDYFNIRQRAVDDARREAGPGAGVYLYQMAEVNLVAKARAGGKTVTNDVLPRLRCDLYGYSAWDTAGQPPPAFLEALRFLRGKANPSFAFGTDNVAVSELGAAENAPGATVAPQVGAMLQALTDDAPYVLMWTLYDNECFETTGGRRANKQDAEASDCVGYWVRRPDGRPGRFYLAFRPYLIRGLTDRPDPTDPGETVDLLYLTLMGRRADPVARAGAIAHLDGRPWDRAALVRYLMVTPEYKARTDGSPACLAFDTYRALFGRDPEPDALPALVRPAPTDADRLAFVDMMLATEEARNRFVDWSCRHILGIPPDLETRASLSESLRLAGSRERFYRDLILRLATP